MQNNMQRSKTVPYEIRTQMGADGDDILLMQEPYNIEGKIPGLGTGVAIAYRGSKYDPPMAVVGIKSKDITPLEVAELFTTHCVCVQISDGETEFYLINQYFPPTENIGKHFLVCRTAMITDKAKLCLENCRSIFSTYCLHGKSFSFGFYHNFWNRY